MNEQFYPRIGETVYRERLENGLEVCVVSKPEHSRSYAFFCTRYGGMDMRFFCDGKWQDTPAGIAHYLEHKMFETEDGDALQTLSRNGADPNAFTSSAITAYYFDCTEHFEENLKTLLSFVSVPYFTEESVAKEQGIIAQEIRMIEDNPDWQVYTKLMQGLYQNSPARVAVAGTVESISHITPELLYSCHKIFYHPSNMILTVVGPVQPETVLSLARKMLPQTAAEPILRDYGQEEGLDVAKAETVLEMEVSMPMFMTGYKFAPCEEGDAFMRQNMLGDMAADILCGESSPLYARLYAEGLINGSFGGCCEMMPGIGFLYMSGDSKDPYAVKTAVEQEVERLCREGIDEEYYQQIRRATFGHLLRQLNSFENIAVSLSECYFRNFDYYRFPEVFDSITKADILAFLQDTVRPERSSICIVKPKEEQV